MWEGVGDRTELQHIDPHSYGYNSVSFPFSWAAQPRAWRPSLSGTWSSFQHLLSNWSGLQLTQSGVLSPDSNFLCTELYYCFTSTQFNLSTVKVIPLISSTGYTCYLHGCISYFDSSAGVNIQQKVWIPLYSKLNSNTTSRRMALALNNLQRLICI